MQTVKSCTCKSTAVPVNTLAGYAKASWDLSVSDLLAWIRKKGWTVDEFKASVFYEKNKAVIPAFRSI